MAERSVIQEYYDEMQDNRRRKREEEASIPTESRGRLEIIIDPDEEPSTDKNAPDYKLTTPSPPVKPKKPVDQTEYEARKELLTSEGYKVPEVAKAEEEKGTIEKNTDNLLDFIYNFERLGSGNISATISNIKRVKKQYQEEGFSPLEGDLGSRIQNEFSRRAQDWEAFKEGATASREDRATGRDLFVSIFGKENIDNVEKKLNEIADSPYLKGVTVDEVLPDIPLKSTISRAIKSTIPVLGLVEHAQGVNQFAVKNIMNGVYGLTELAMDPVTYIPFGGPVEILKAGTETALKGTMAGLAKVSPEIATSIEKMAKKSSEYLAQKANLIYKNLYPKGAATNAAVRKLGEDKGIATIDDIHILANKPAQEVEEILNKISEDVPIPSRLGIVRNNLNKLAKATDYNPTSRAGKWLLGMTDERKFLDETTTALRNISDETSANLANWTSEEVQGLLRRGVEGKLDESEMKRLFDAYEKGALDTKYTPKEVKTAPAEIGMKETVNLEKELARDLKEEFVSGKGAVASEARKLAAARRDLRRAQLDSRYEVLKGVYKNTQSQTQHLTKEMQKNVDWVSNELKLTGKIELEKNLRKIRQDMSESIQDVELRSKQSIKDLMSQKNPAETPVKRKQWLRDRDKQIANIKLESERTKNAITAQAKQKMVDTTNGLRTQGEKLYAKSVSNIANIYKSKVKDVQYGIPTREGLDALYDAADKKIAKQWKSEQRFFETQLRKVKFAEAYNNMLTKRADEFNQIFEKGIKKLPKEYQGLARSVRDVMDIVHNIDVSTGRNVGYEPNYFPRLAMAGSEGMNILTKEDFEKNLRVMMNSSGVSKFTKQRVMANYEGFLKAVQKRGLKPVDDIFDIVYNRVLSSKKEQVYHDILKRVPEVLKVNIKNPSDRDVKAVKHYLKYLFRGGTQFDNAVLRKGSELLNKYNFVNKSMLTVMSPIFHFTNLFSGPSMTAAKAGMKAYNPNTYLEAAAMKLGLAKQIIDKNGRKMAVEDFIRAGNEYGNLSSTYASKDIPKNVDRILERYPKYGLRWFMTKATAVGQEVEEMNRIHSAYTFWKDGMDLKKAWRKSRETQFDYSDTNEFVKGMNGLLAFYTWHAKNLSAQAKAMINDPKQFSILSNIIRNLSGGNQLTSEQIDALNSYDKDQVMITKDMVDGLQPLFKFGFLPISSAYDGVSKLIRGDIDGYLGDQASMIKPALKPILREIGQSLEQPGDTSDGKSPLLSERLTYLFASSPKSVKLLNNFQEMLGQGPVRVEDVPVWRKGEQVMEKRIRVSPWMNVFLNNVPFSRQLSETGGVIQQAADREGMGPSPDTVGDLIASGAFENTGDILKYLFGVKQKDINWDEMAEKLKKRQFNAVTEELVNKGLGYKMTVFPKEVRDQLKEIKTRMKVEQSQ